MTDKEKIIIDGVDVRNCKGIDLSLSPLVKCKSLKFKTSDGGIAGIWCSDHTNCYYKQLARKTQVIDEIEEVIKPYQEQIELDALSLPSAIESILERKTQEYEELKEELAIYKKMLDDPEFKIALTDVRTGEREVWRKLGSKADRYHKALEEIEQELKEDIYCESQECGCDDFEECLKCTKDLILNIIDKAKQGTMSK